MADSSTGVVAGRSGAGWSGPVVTSGSSTPSRPRHIALCRAALDAAPVPLPPTMPDAAELPNDPEPNNTADPLERARCPACHIGLMTVLRRYARPVLAPTIPTVPQLVW